MWPPLLLSITSWLIRLSLKGAVRYFLNAKLLYIDVRKLFLFKTRFIYLNLEKDIKLIVNEYIKTGFDASMETQP